MLLGIATAQDQNHSQREAKQVALWAAISVPQPIFGEGGTAKLTINFGVVNDLLVKARTVTDQAERAKLYQRMQEIEHEEVPELLLAHSTVYESMRSNVSGYKQSPLGTHAFEGVDLQ